MGHGPETSPRRLRNWVIVFTLVASASVGATSSPTERPATRLASVHDQPLTQYRAYRRMAVILAHWDNKGENQRLLCPSGRELPDGGCTTPIAMIQDLGATFGPLRVDLPSWRSARVWHDRARCTVDMSDLPYGGGTFPERPISEAGRLMLAGLLEQLSRSQLRALFTASRITVQDVIDAEARNADAWVKVFLDKVREIRAAGPCPS